jgi:ABC-2 type transport system ATP-binding protein
LLLSISDLVKVYRGGVRANDGVSISVEEGEIFGLLGHNGAGKTTLVNQVVGLLAPTAGSIHIDGRDAVADPGYARRVCSIQPQAQVPLNGLTPRQAMDLVGRLRGGSASRVRERATRLAEALEIGEWLDRGGENLSAGVKRLASFCMTAVTPGRVVILDEPTNDVDPVRRRLLWTQVRVLAEEGAAVLLVTHNVLEAERAVDRLAILDHGRVIAEGTPGELKSGVADDLRLELVLEPGVELGSTPAFVRRMVPGVNRVTASIGLDDAGSAVRWAGELRRDRKIEEFGLVPATLEDAYVELVARAGQEEATRVHAA